MRDAWVQWGSVLDVHATLPVVRDLQADGYRVRVVHDGAHNDIYVEAQP